MLGRWRSFYGANPLHLLALLACFGLAGYAALWAKKGPLPMRMLIWFVGAIVAHDLLLYPLYALADRSLAGLINRRRVSHPPTDAGGVNYLRVPALLSGLLLLMFWPLITRHSSKSYRFATGLNNSVYLGRWLLLSGAACAVSAVLYAWRIGRRRHRPPPTAETTTG
ncbi:MAG: hypothetical protein M3083_06435 [Actinomycetota bacterium]|nr:hypothetical protein [Actinomycetota bacterium]